MGNAQLPGEVCFISAVCPPSGKATSTDIMTNNLLHGLKQIGMKLTLVAICKEKDNKRAINEYYSAIADRVILADSFFMEENPGKFRFLKECWWKIHHLKAYTRLVSESGLTISEDALILANKVYSDEIMYGYALKQQHPKARFYQYWSDPMTLSGILPEALKSTPRRWLFWYLEKAFLRTGDRIIYGTKVLMDFQKRLYPSLADRMYYVDVSYNALTEDSQVLDIGDSHRLIYGGNYHSSIRNIKPLLGAMKNLPDYHLDVFGSGDVEDPQISNVTFHGRVSPDELAKYEKQCGINVAILNHSCIQIPGKVFYGMNHPGKILVIADGPYKGEIMDYLTRYSRFIICENSARSVCETVGKAASCQCDRALLKQKFSAYSIAVQLIHGGMNV